MMEERVCGGRAANGDTFELRLELKTLRWWLHRAWLQPQLA